ncbi:uncharacterized protein Z518_10100 [Rhinocladiella mackenziei CBS 650.93]|uniref:Uncharacterized protein n=1 Tax=Rhinocladiella mackenziei CBS 650.93 TaxID=1442369 RepID=A0A0D2I5I5_9EURO|nr:uncharacterized protein Z518_10100 [Rhinocladiella mackenziei CBS 650.93]KIX01034.1 hypothetical protein Z518_10100 [Rhinocladiella mackenziei CBS 650.93]
MATTCESSDMPRTYALISRSSPSVAESKETTPDQISPEMSPLQGLERTHIHQYKSFRGLRGCVKSLSTALMAGRTNQQFLVFRDVKKDDLAEIDAKRESIGRHARMSCYTYDNLLIIKLMPSVEHEMVHRNLGENIKFELIQMGIKRNHFPAVGAGRYSRPHSSKEGDTAYKPATRDQKTDFPTIVLESGLSESLNHLRHDARWWLSDPTSHAEIVLLISIRQQEKMLLVEKWCLAPASASRPTTRAQAASTGSVPTKVQELMVIQNPTPHLGSTAQASTFGQPTVTIQPGTTSAYDVAGAPLVLEFQKLLLRTPIPPERDIFFSPADLAEWADGVWESAH